jgi:hypothetical protein
MIEALAEGSRTPPEAVMASIAQLPTAPPQGPPAVPAQISSATVSHDTVPRVERTVEVTFVGVPVPGGA